MSSMQEPLVEPITNPEDFTQVFHCVSEAFGRQISDTVWLAFNPDWESEKGQKRGVEQLAHRFKGVKTNKNGQPNTVFLKATLPSQDDATERKVAGMAIWQQCSFVDGHGDPPSTDFGKAVSDLDPKEARFASQMLGSMWARRIETTREKATADPPAIFVLDMCCVHPSFQRRGVAQKLVQWGLDEAGRRGNLECTTEASSMGRGAYKKLGFRDEGVGDIVYEVDEEFKGRRQPPNLFLRTGPA